MANRKRSIRREEARVYKIFLPYAGVEMVVGAAQWQQHLKVGNILRSCTDPDTASKLAANPRLAVVKPGLFAYEDTIAGTLKFGPLQGFKEKLVSPTNSHQAGWQNWLYMPPFNTANEASRLQYAAQPRYRETDYRDPNNRVEVW